ncbi:acyl-CoA thioesterase [Amycolatopsis sp. CM201R]|nr:acyl-CoA thioesterase [Amycolatopsis sp. 505]MDS0148632.1 acyl-CoA thioesterase [Amycolatopsis sp. CM201R]
MDDHDTNLMGTVHGGVLMKLADSLAGVVSARHSEGASVTASVDEMVFRVPVRVGDVLHLHAQVNWAGSTSMEIGVRATADRWDRSVPPVHVASAYLVLVAVDEDGRPRPVPPVLPETDEDRRRYAEAGIRRTHRLARRAAITASRTVA